MENDTVTVAAANDSAMLQRALELQKVAPSGQVRFFTQFDMVLMFHVAAGRKGVHQVGKPLARIDPDLINYKMNHVNAKFEAALLSLEEMEETDARQVALAFNNLIDVVYYVYSICAVLGLPFDSGFAIVHAANMKKLMVPEIKFQEDGRVGKPGGWESPTEALKKLVLDAAEEAGTVDAPGAV